MLDFFSCVGYYGYIYIIAVLGEINALQVRQKSAKPERLQGVENQPGKVRQKRKNEQIVKLQKNQGKIGKKYFLCVDFYRIPRGVQNELQ